MSTRFNPDVDVKGFVKVVLIFYGLFILVIPEKETVTV